MTFSPLLLAGGLALLWRPPSLLFIAGDLGYFLTTASNPSDSYITAPTPNKRLHPDTPSLQGYRKRYFRNETPNPWWITLYSHEVESELQSLKKPFHWDVFSAQLSGQLGATWGPFFSQAKRNRLFEEEQKKEYQKFLIGPSPKTNQELRAFVEKLRQRAAALGADFDLSEGIINGWHEALARGQTNAQKIGALKSVEPLFPERKDKIILEALKVARGYFLIAEEKYLEARQIALEGEKSHFASIRYFSRLLKTDAELRIGGYPAPLFSTPSFDLSQQKGKVVVLYFWQSWCPPCAKKLPELQALRRKHGGKIVFIGISNAKLESNSSELLTLREKSGVTFPQITDNGFSTGTFRILNYPRTIIVDKKGRAWLLSPYQDIEKELQRFL